MNEFAQAILSWPMVSIIVVVIFHKQLSVLILRLIRSDSGGEAEIGPIKIKLGKMAEEGKKVVGILNRISMVMAESRRLELEIISGGFAFMLSEEQNREMNKHISTLTELTKEAEKSLVVYGEDTAGV